VRAEHRQPRREHREEDRQTGAGDRQILRADEEDARRPGQERRQTEGPARPQAEEGLRAAAGGPWQPVLQHRAAEHGHPVDARHQDHHHGHEHGP